MTTNNSFESLSYSGYCNNCKKIHSLPFEKALPHCYELMKQLEVHRRIDFDVAIEKANSKLSTDHLYTDSGGEMLGVLVCEDFLGKEIVLRAFSSTHNGIWNVAGWVPHIADEAKYMSIVENNNLAIHPLTHLIQSLEKGSDEWFSTILERKTESKKTLSKLFELYELTNFKKVKLPLSKAFNQKKGIPNGTGDCCAPKLLNFAAINNLKPLSIAEFYWGKTPLSGLKTQGWFYSSCRDKCQPLLGFMLCGIT